jgi:hypothetical protein
MRLRNWSIIKVFRHKLHPENLEIVSPGIEALSEDDAYPLELK